MEAKLAKQLPGESRPGGKSCLKCACVHRYRYPCLYSDNQVKYSRTELEMYQD